jgi:hypothetical protein
VKNAKAKWEECLVLGQDMIRIPHGYAMSLDGIISMMGMKPSVESANSMKLFGRNLQEEYPTTNHTPEQDRNLATFQSERKLVICHGNLSIAKRQILVNRLLLVYDGERQAPPGSSKSFQRFRLTSDPSRWLTRHMSYRYPT